MMTQILIRNIQDDFKTHSKIKAFLPLVLTLIFISSANLPIYAQACSQVTFSRTFTSVLHTEINGNTLQ